jgi:chromosomal replication initiator protein
MKAAAKTPVRPAALEQALVERIGEPRYQLWFASRTHFRLVGDLLTVGVPNLYLQEYLQKKFNSAILAAAREIARRTVAVKFTIDPKLFQAARAEQEAVKNAATAPARGGRGGGHDGEPEPASPPTPLPRRGRGTKAGAKRAEAKPARRGAPAKPPTLDPPPRPETRYAPGPPPTLFEPPNRPARANARAPAGGRRWHHLREFVAGPCNRVAFAAAQSVVEEPGQGPNPLVIHGPVGTGKTHLLEGIYAGLRKQYPDARVIYITAEDFTNRFVQALRTGKLAAFRKHFREADVLLLDDVHFLARKRATHEEFQHTLDALMADGKQVVVTCDCHPRLTDDFPPELADRLIGGAVWGLQPPDAATRLDLLRAKAGQAKAPIAEGVLKFLAGQLRGNVRELEGALHSLRHYAQVTGRPIDVALAREALGDLLRHAVRVVRLEDVDTAVCQVLRLPQGTLQSKARAWSVSHPRMLAVYLARKLTAASYAEIGQYFGGRNHSTAVAAEKKVRKWLQDDGALALNERSWRVRELIEMAERHLGK